MSHRVPGPSCTCQAAGDSVTSLMNERSGAQSTSLTVAMVTCAAQKHSHRILFRRSSHADHVHQQPLIKLDPGLLTFSSAARFSACRSTLVSTDSDALAGTLISNCVGFENCASPISHRHVASASSHRNAAAAAAAAAAVPDSLVMRAAAKRPDINVVAISKWQKIAHFT
jgi:hypothetical protein